MDVMTIIIPDSFMYHSVTILSETIRELLPLNCALILQKRTSTVNRLCKS